MIEDISPRDSLEHLLRYWWIVAVAMTLGGLLGWGIGQISPPVYEARAEYRVLLDDEALLAELHKTKPEAELTYVDRAPYLTPVSEVFFMPEIRMAVQERALAAGLDFPPDGFRNGQLTLDNRRSDWKVIVRHSNSETAAQLANLWVDVADGYLRNAREQSVLAASLKLHLNLLSKCFESSSLSDGNHCAGTSFSSPDEVERRYQEVDSLYQAAFSAGEGISPLVSFEPGEAAEAPLRPIYYNTGLLMLMGSLLGLIVGGVIVQKLPLK
jgi:hypothetical protein